MSAVIEADSEEAAFEIACEMNPLEADGSFRMIAVQLNQEESAS